MVESALFDEYDINCDVRIPESLYNFQSDNKQVFVENHSVNKVHLNVGKRIRTVRHIEPVINECIKNASVRLGTETLHCQQVTLMTIWGCFLQLHKYKSTFQTDLEKRNLSFKA